MFRIITTVADTPQASEVREYSLDTLPALLKPLAYILQWAWLISESSQYKKMLRSIAPDVVTRLTIIHAATACRVTPGISEEARNR